MEILITSMREYRLRGRTLQQVYVFGETRLHDGPATSRLRLAETDVVPACTAMIDSRLTCTAIRSVVQNAQACQKSHVPCPTTSARMNRVMMPAPHSER